MIAALILAAATPAAAVPAPLASTDDIVVTARRLSKVRFSYHVSRGRLERCDISRSSSSPAIDGVVCQAVRQCAVEQPDQSDRGLVPCIRDRVRALAIAARAH